MQQHLINTSRNPIMLTTEHRAIIKSTVPLLESGGEALITYFYATLLDENPELRAIFNQTNQASGDQPRALAKAVLMYARHIDNLAPLSAMVARIINKHVALQILPEHYPIVGAGLIGAIRKVLGPEIATDAVIDAWERAYCQLSSLLIGAEEGLYADKENARGGWRGARRFRIARKVAESDEITSFYLRPVDDGPVLASVPGQYITLRVVVDGEEMRRNYSLSDESADGEYRISVKREAHGKVSNFLHGQLHENDEIDLFAPSGNFTLTGGAKPLVLISGGVGITPTMAMLHAALRTGRPIHFIHAARHGGVHAFRDHVNGLAARHDQLRVFYNYSEQREGDTAPAAVGLLTQARLAQWLPEERDIDVYFLGPIGFMQSVKSSLKGLGVPEEQSRFEFFGPAAEMA
jgi:nitric oxide dioxygenase